MTEPIAYLNGQYIPISQTALSVFDLGIVAGASVTEMIRTFRHQPFRLEAHLDRLAQSLTFLEIPFDVVLADLHQICLKVVRENSRSIYENQELGLVCFVTAGQNLTYLGRANAELAQTPSVCVHTFPLPFELWAGHYKNGLHLVTTNVESLPDNVINPSIKHRNRLHWILADREAKRIDPAAMALLLDQDGYLTETATGNLCVVEGSTILTPENHVLNGISRDVVHELAISLGMTMAYTRLAPEDLYRSSEAFLTSTPHCLLPVTKFNHRLIGQGLPGPVFQQLIAAWSELVGVDVMQQMQDGASNSTLGRA